MITAYENLNVTSTQSAQDKKLNAEFDTVYKELLKVAPAGELSLYALLVVLRKLIINAGGSV